MICKRTAPRRRLAPLAAAGILAAALLPLATAGWAPLPAAQIGAVRAADPSAAPSSPPSPDPAATVTPTDPPTPSPPPADPSAPPSASPAPSGEPTPTPTAPPTPFPAASPTPAPAPAPSADPSASPSATASPAPSPSPAPSAAAPSASPSASPSPAPTSKPLIAYSLSPGQQAGAAVSRPLPLYRLTATQAPAASAPDSPHTGYTLTSPDCASCHATHTGQETALLDAPAPQASVCYTCHSGSGSTFDVQADFAGLPANSESADAYYTHPVADASNTLHVLDTEDEFGGVSNRHAVCADCHNAHDATGSRPHLSTTGWTAGGDIAGAAGVAVANGAAGSAPAYTLVPPGQGLTYEYQLCLKCHSGRTTLPVRSTANPSYWALDKGIELNPANTSFHPLEAPGRNLTAQMAASLAGSSPFKAWTFTIDATIRCTNCHGDPSTVDQTATATPKQPAANADEASHGSPNRGLLTAPYRDRALKPAGEAYDSADFALCYLCHAERPFVDPNADPSAPDTLFSLHGMHLTQIAGVASSNLSIDHPGDGGGLGICAECHFRIHSTAEAYQPGDTAPTARTTGDPSLVDFAPDVTGVGTLAPTWNQPDSQGRASCTLTCHGYTHLASSTQYTVAPGTGFTADPTGGAAGTSGLTVQFTDATRYVSPTGATWSWDFGDGTTSSLRNPSHKYAAAGSYTVTLTVRRTIGNSLSTTMTRPAYITVTP